MLHLFNGFMNPYGGSELETLSLSTLLATKTDVKRWATSSRASKELCEHFSIRHVAPQRRQVPNGGTYVFLGAHWRNKLWPYLIPRPSRLIYVFNTFHPKIIDLTARMPTLLRWPRAELVLISEFQKQLLGLDGVVHPSPIDIQRFIPRPELQPEQFTIGRMSRDTSDKHHDDDLPLYGELLQDGTKVRIQGGTYLVPKLAEHAGLSLLPAGCMPAEQFLATLDVFYYRTGEHVETFGRVVFEAMACGLPVVCHAYGGYADHIRHGENGFLFESTEQARRILAELKADPALRARIGCSARATVEQMFSEAALERRLDFYLRKPSI